MRVQAIERLIGAGSRERAGLSTASPCHKVRVAAKLSFELAASLPLSDTPGIASHALQHDSSPCGRNVFLHYRGHGGIKRFHLTNHSKFGIYSSPITLPPSCTPQLWGSKELWSYVLYSSKGEKEACCVDGAAMIGSGVYSDGCVLRRVPITQVYVYKMR